MALPTVLVHSPSVGPATWLPCARLLQAGGVDAVVPDLRSVGRGGPPYWPRVVTTVLDAMGQLDEPGSVALVAHSNAGLFVPAVIEASPRPVTAVVLVDAAMPLPTPRAVPAGAGPPRAGPPRAGPAGSVPAAPPEFMARLRALAGPDGLLPRWTDWWSDDDVAALLPDPRVRQEVVADQPRLPLDYYEQVVPIPAGWPPARGAYLQFTPAYDDDAGRARAAGWLVERMAGEHLHQVVDPVSVTDVIRGLVERSARS